MALVGAGLVVVVVASYPRTQIASTGAATLAPIHFAPGTTDISPRDRTILDAHAAWLKRAGNPPLLIEGHTDEPGKHGISADVGRDRAQSAHAYLVFRGVSTDRLEVVSRGGERPICTERTPACRAANRRVTFSPRTP